MKLFILRPREDLPRNRLPVVKASSVKDPWSCYCGIDKGLLICLIVRAENEKRAREIAQNNALDESKCTSKAWKSKKFSTCFELTGDGQEGLIMKNKIH